MEEYLKVGWEHTSVILGIRHAKNTRRHFSEDGEPRQPVNQFSGGLPRQCSYLMSVPFLSKLHRCPPSLRRWSLTSCVLLARPDYHTLTSAPHKNSWPVSPWSLLCFQRPASHLGPCFSTYKLCDSVPVFPSAWVWPSQRHRIPGHSFFPSLPLPRPLLWLFLLGTRRVNPGGPPSPSPLSPRMTPPFPVTFLWLKQPKDWFFMLSAALPRYLSHYRVLMLAQYQFLKN